MRSAKKMNMLKKTLRNKKGQATVELVFSLILYAAALLSIVDMSRLFYTWASLQFSINEAGRWGSVQNASANRLTDIQNRVAAKAAQFLVTVNPQNVQVSNSNTALAYMNVRASSTVNLNPFTGLLLSLGGNHSGAYTVTAESMVRNENI